MRWYLCGTASINTKGKHMPLMPVALRATADRTAVRFAMKDGAKTVMVLVANPALDDIDIALPDCGHLDIFKQYRKSFEQLASAKYDRGHLEQDGSVCIRAIDLAPAASST